MYKIYILGILENNNYVVRFVGGKRNVNDISVLSPDRIKNAEMKSDKFEVIYESDYKFNYFN